jgi:hypothetical protein
MVPRNIPKLRERQRAFFFQQDLLNFSTLTLRGGMPLSAASAAKRPAACPVSIVIGCSRVAPLARRVWEMFFSAARK